MLRCDVCGNFTERALEVRVHGDSYVFDSFECAIHKLALECDHCGCRIIGHGVESDARHYCCAHCALEQEHSELKDAAALVPARPSQAPASLAGALNRAHRAR
jgi:hypothetical protein